MAAASKSKRKLWSHRLVQCARTWWLAQSSATETIDAIKRIECCVWSSTPAVRLSVRRCELKVAPAGSGGVSPMRRAHGGSRTCAHGSEVVRWYKYDDTMSSSGGRTRWINRHDDDAATKNSRPLAHDVRPKGVLLFEIGAHELCSQCVVHRQSVGRPLLRQHGRRWRGQHGGRLSRGTTRTLVASTFRRLPEASRCRPRDHFRWRAPLLNFENTAPRTGTPSRPRPRAPSKPHQ